MNTIAGPIYVHQHGSLGGAIRWAIGELQDLIGETGPLAGRRNQIRDLIREALEFLALSQPQEAQRRLQQIPGVVFV